MCRYLTIVITIAMTGFFGGVGAFSHPATERYIPIGESPGISNVQSYLGAILSVRTTEGGFTMSVDGSDQLIEVTDDTKIYLDKGPGKTNSIGSEADCQVGRVVEVYLHEGKVYWVKIRIP